MRDPRVTRLADVLVNYSTAVRPGDLVAIRGEHLAHPLLLAIYEEVVKAGGFPTVTVALPGATEAMFQHGSDRQLDWLNPITEYTFEEVDVLIGVSAPENSRALTEVPPEKQSRVSLASRPLMLRQMERAAADELRWTGTVFPTQMVAADAEMSLAAYEDLYFSACLCHLDDPVAAWREAARETQRLSEWISGREDVHITGPGTDIRLSIAGRHFIAGDGQKNMPDGEFFTGPVEDSAHGVITFDLPTLHGGRAVSGIRFEFRDGKVVGATADQGEDYLLQMLDSDPGARFLGELGIGSNFGITRGTRSILLDEKIGGTVHLAIGQSYPETGGCNQSSQHWDMVCDLRQGGSMTVDGDTLLQDGRFVV